MPCWKRRCGYAEPASATCGYAKPTAFASPQSTARRANSRILFGASRYSAPSPDIGLGQIVNTKQVYQVDDARAAPTFGDKLRLATIELAGARTLLGVPMLKDGEVIGVLAIYRREVRQFTDKQIELVKNFAAQAVIAIENTRLLNELRQRTTDLTEALEQQTATSEVLSVISSSPGRLEPVFQAMLENATRICGAKYGIMYRHNNGEFQPAAMYGVSQEVADYLTGRGTFRPPATRRSGRLPEPKSPSTFLTSQTSRPRVPARIQTWRGSLIP